MRRLALTVLAVVLALVGTGTAGGSGSSRRVSAGQGISLRLPHGWYLIRRAVGASQATRPRPSQPLVLASFPVSFARRPCPCAHPNYRNCGAWCEETGIRNFPAGGALVYVWEFPVPRNPAALGRGFVRRPSRFQVSDRNPHFAKVLARELRHQHRQAGHACVEGPGSLPSWWSQFRAAGRAFQVEVYLGPRAGSHVRPSLDELLDSLRVHRTPRSSPSPRSPSRVYSAASARSMTLAQFASLRLGESEADVANRFGSPARRTSVARYGFTHDEPRHMRCIYYRRRFPDERAPSSTSDTFQLCFKGQRLRYRWAYIASRA